MVKILYIPERGDLIWVSLNPTAGHEQKGRRPAIVLSPKAYNFKTGLAFVCPITSQAKGYPFEAVIKMKSADCAVLVDQARSIDWQKRKAEFIGRAGAAILPEIQAKLNVLIGG